MIAAEENLLLYIGVACLAILALPVALWALRWVLVGALTVGFAAWGWVRYLRTRNRPPAVGQLWRRDWGTGIEVQVRRVKEGPYPMFVVGSPPDPTGRHSWSQAVPADQFKDMVKRSRMVLVDEPKFEVSA